MLPFDNICKTATGQGDDYTNGCLLDYSYFKEHYKMILSKQQALYAGPKAMQQIKFTGNLDQEGTFFFIIEEVKEVFWIFHKKLCDFCKFIFI